MIILFAFGLGIAHIMFMIPIRVCSEIMPERKGTIIGILFFAIAVSPVFFNQLIQIVINPEKSNPMKDEYDNVF